MREYEKFVNIEVKEPTLEEFANSNEADRWLSNAAFDFTSALGNEYGFHYWQSDLNARVRNVVRGFLKWTVRMTLVSNFTLSSKEREGVVDLDVVHRNLKQIRPDLNIYDIGLNGTYSEGRFGEPYGEFRGGKPLGHEALAELFREASERYFDNVRMDQVKYLNIPTKFIGRLNYPEGKVDVQRIRTKEGEAQWLREVNRLPPTFYPRNDSRIQLTVKFEDEKGTRSINP